MAFTPVLTQAVIKTIYQAIGDFAKQSGLFTGGTDDHESRNPPGKGLSCEVLMGPIEPATRGSGLSATSARWEFTVRVSAPRMATPDGETDQAVAYAGAYLIGAFTNDFDLEEIAPSLPDGLMRMVDVLGAYGDPLKFEPGWLTRDGSPYRVGELTLPLILNDVFPQGA
jgi:hypothetical protein